MEQRKYSVAEIDRMRELINFSFTGQLPRNLEEIVEHRLRTYMLNGTEPAELEAKILTPYPLADVVEESRSKNK